MNQKLLTSKGLNLSKEKYRNQILNYQQAENQLKAY
jgi:hypothetical protein